MFSYEDGMAVAPSLTVRSLLYEYDPDEMHEAAESRVA
jgi:hypothetical protein